MSGVQIPPSLHDLVLDSVLRLTFPNQSTLFRYLLADKRDERQEGTRKQMTNGNVQLARHRCGTRYARHAGKVTLENVTPGRNTRPNNERAAKDGPTHKSPPPRHQSGCEGYWP
jgi:hypothetical protein